MVQTVECVPYSQQACEDAADELGLQKGGDRHSFAGYYQTKGCYAYVSGAYANTAFYGIGGSDEEMRAQPFRPKYRPVGYDCSINGKSLHCLQF